LTTRHHIDIESENIMRIFSTLFTGLILTLVATAARADSIFTGAMDYESPLPMILHVGGRLIGRLFS